jgi:hypothetical protein
MIREEEITALPLQRPQKGFQGCQFIRNSSLYVPITWTANLMALASSIKEANPTSLSALP